MTGRALLACMRKEALLLWRDRPMLLLLFVMPAVFILVMSLALEDRFADGDASLATVLVVDADTSASSRRLVERLAENSAFALVTADAALSAAALRQRVRAGDVDLGLRIEQGFGEVLRKGRGAPGRYLHIVIAPEIDRQRAALFTGAVRRSITRARIAQLAGRLGRSRRVDPATLGRAVEVTHLYGGDASGRRPTSVQQNVPAWLVFGMFFVVIPLSNTFIRERQSGMDRRLATTPASGSAILAGKLAPYFGLNMLQALVMLAVGVWLVPALGGQALRLAGVPVATLVLMTVAVSAAALGYALFVAAVSRTTEQAAMLGGGGNIILAAIGGIMVPAFVMPPALRALTNISPMAWGLDGFLTAFLRHGGPAAVLGEAAALLAFGAVGIALAIGLQRWRND